MEAKRRSGSMDGRIEPNSKSPIQNSTQVVPGSNKDPNERPLTRTLKLQFLSCPLNI